MSVGTELDLEAILAEFHAQTAEPEQFPEPDLPQEPELLPEAEEPAVPVEATTVFNAHTGEVPEEISARIPKRQELPAAPESEPEEEPEPVRKPHRSRRKARGRRRMAFVLTVLALLLAACLWWALGEEANAEKQQEREPLSICLTDSLESELENAAYKR